LIFQNKTLIESLEKSNKNIILNSKNNDNESLLIESYDEEKIKKLDFFNNKYDKGAFKNFQEVFGKNLLLWLIPITFKSLERGGYDYNIYKLDSEFKEVLKDKINQLKENSTISIDLAPDLSERKLNKLFSTSFN